MVMDAHVSQHTYSQIETFAMNLRMVMGGLDIVDEELSAAFRKRGHTVSARTIGNWRGAKIKYLPQDSIEILPAITGQPKEFWYGFVGIDDVSLRAAKLSFRSSQRCRVLPDLGQLLIGPAYIPLLNAPA